jgi:serine/threonine protein kinase
LHSRNILHRDLKASDVLSNEDKDGNYQCLVSNFECSIGVVGTRFFMSPEVLQGIRNTLVAGLFVGGRYSFASQQ